MRSRAAAQIVFVTAYEQYAVQAFEQGAIDYVVKPFDEARLADTVARLKERLAERAARQGDSAQLDAVLEQLARRAEPASPTATAPAMDPRLGGQQRAS